MLKAGIRFTVSGNLTLAHDGDDKFIGQTGTIVSMCDWIYPVQEVKFDNDQVQEHYVALGKRHFDECELTPIL